MKTLLTGSRGFIGRRVLPLLHAAGHEVLCLDRGDLDAAARFAPELVIHLAWPGVTSADRADYHLQRDGFALTLQLLRCVFPGCRRWVQAGSQAQETQPRVYYASFKTAAAAAARATCWRHEAGCAEARIYSVYGPGDHPANFIPYLVRELKAGRDPALTDQNLLWDFLFVDDCAAAIVAIAASDVEGVVPVASGRKVFTRDVARILRGMIAPEAVLRFGARPRRAVEIDGLRANIDALVALGWSPRVTLDEGLRRTIDETDGTRESGESSELT